MTTILSKMINKLIKFTHLNNKTHKYKQYQKSEKAENKLINIFLNFDSSTKLVSNCCISV